MLEGQERQRRTIRLSFGMKNDAVRPRPGMVGEKEKRKLGSRCRGRRDGFQRGPVGRLRLEGFFASEERV